MGPVSGAVPGALLGEVYGVGAGQASRAHAQPTAAITVL